SRRSRVNGRRRRPDALRLETLPPRHRRNCGPPRKRGGYAMRSAEPWIEPVNCHERNRDDLSRLDGGGRRRFLRLSAWLLPFPRAADCGDSERRHDFKLFPSAAQYGPSTRRFRIDLISIGGPAWRGPGGHELALSAALARSSVTGSPIL